MSTELRQFAEFDWVTTDRATVLHHVRKGDFNEDAWLIYEARFTCGRKAAIAYIPGISTRMREKRCDRCCDRLGYPRGIGSPKNDPACRELAQRRVESLP